MGFHATFEINKKMIEDSKESQQFFMVDFIWGEKIRRTMTELGRPHPEKINRQQESCMIHNRRGTLQLARYRSQPLGPKVPHCQDAPTVDRKY